MKIYVKLHCIVNNVTIYTYLLSGFSRKVTIRNYMSINSEVPLWKKEQSLIQEQINRGLSFISSLNYWQISLDRERKEQKDRIKFKNTLLVPVKVYVTLIGPKGNKSEFRKSYLCAVHNLIVAFQKICRAQSLF